MIDARGAEFYPTPKWVTLSLLENEPFNGTILEPACGSGAISKVLLSKGYDVISCDVNDFGFGIAGINFLKDSRTADNIITNPPFSIADWFVTSALKKAPKVAMLLRLAFLESQARYNEIFSITPPARVLVFSKRITMYPEGKITGGSGTMAFAWFIWDAAYKGETILKWIAPK